MKTKNLFILWACLFILCASLGFIPESSGIGTVLLVSLSLLFFLPGVILLRRAQKNGDRTLLRAVRTVSAVSLGSTVLLLLANFLCVTASQAVGDFLYVLLVIFSSPMFCGRYWIVSLFLWACLLIASFGKTGKDISAD